MEQIIREMIERAIYYKENLNFIEESESYDLLKFARELIYQMVMTINCPSNWRDIGRKFAKEYRNNSWVFEELELWNYEEE